MTRRFNTTRGNISFFLLFLILGVGCHINLALTETVGLNLYPIPLMIAIYLGYKLGRWTGLVAGVSISSFATIVVLFKERMQINWIELLFDGVSLSSDYGPAFFGPSIEHIVLAGVLGWVSGFLFDCLDNVLGKEGLSLDRLIPPRRTSVLVWIWQYSNRRFAFQRYDDPKAKSDKDKKANRRWPHKVVIPPAVIVLAILNIYPRLWLTENIEATLWPQYLAAVGVLVVAFHTRSGKGVRLAFTVWIISLLIVLMLSPKFSEQGNIILLIQTPAQAVGLAILAWWCGKIGRILRDPEKRAALSRLWSAYCRKHKDEAEPGYSIVFVVLLLVIGTELQFKALLVCYRPLILLSLVGALWSIRHNRTAVSNRVTATLVCFTLLFGCWFCAEDVAIRPQPLDFVYLVTLGLIPLVVGKMELSTTSRCRLAVFGILTACVLTDLYIRGSMPSFPVLSIAIHYHRLMIAEWTLTLLALEAASRLVCYYASRRSSK